MLQRRNFGFIWSIFTFIIICTNMNVPTTSPNRQIWVFSPLVVFWYMYQIYAYLENMICLWNWLILWTRLFRNQWEWDVQILWIIWFCQVRLIKNGLYQLVTIMMGWAITILTYSYSILVPFFCFYFLVDTTVQTNIHFIETVIVCSFFCGF